MIRKQTFADKLAEKQFHSDAIQKSWSYHENAFGPILNPAFVDDYQAKVAVCAALNLISNRKLQEGLKKIDHIKKFVETDADKALVLFMMALVFEFAGMQEQMISCYNECNSFNHNFYMPYLKIAKLAQNEMLDASVDNYEKALNCLKNEELNTGTKTIISSIYTNYASALIMKHDLDKAKEMLDKSIEINPEQIGREATLAIYHAAKNDRDQAIDTLNSIDNQQLFVQTKGVVMDILEDKHFQFHEFEINEDKIKNFWNWFIENEEELRNNLKNRNNEPVINGIYEHLNEVFDFLEKKVEFGIGFDKDIFELEFCDNYAVAINKGLEKLLNQSPDLEYWKFKIIR